MGLLGKLFGRQDPKLRELIAQFNSLDSDFQMFGAGKDTPDESVLRQAEQDLNCRFPSQYRDFQKVYGGFYLQVKEEVWPRAREFEVAPYWTFIYGFVILGFGGSDIPDMLNIAKNARTFQEETGNAELIPFLKELGSADRYCFTPAGKIVLWDHAGGHQEEQNDFCSVVSGITSKLVVNKEREEIADRRKKYPEKGGGDG